MSQNNSFAESRLVNYRLLLLFALVSALSNFPFMPSLKILMCMNHHKREQSVAFNSLFHEILNAY